MTAPKVSVIVPTYNHADYLADAVRSVLAQTYENLEVIVADDGSCDATPRIIESIATRDARVRPSLSPVNQGISANTNRALDLCTGTYIAVLSGDDLMYPERIATQVAFLEQRPEYGVCGHDVEVFDSLNGRVLYRTSDRFRRRQGGIEVLFPSAWLLGPLVHSVPSSHMFRQSVVGTHRFDPRFRFWNENLWEIECLATSGLRWMTLPVVLGRYRVHGGQASTHPDHQWAIFEETLMALAVVSARYPGLERSAKALRDFAVFWYLINGKLPHAHRPQYERHLRINSGYGKWLYYRAVRSILARARLRTLLNAPWRTATQIMIAASLYRDRRARRRLEL